MGGFGAEQMGLDMPPPEERPPARAENVSGQEAEALRHAAAQRLLRESFGPEVLGAEVARPEGGRENPNEVVFKTEKGKTFLVKFKNGEPVDAQKLELES